MLTAQNPSHNPYLVEVLKKVACWYFLLFKQYVVVMETMCYTSCVPSVISMRVTVSKFEKWRTKFYEKCLGLLLYLAVMETMYFARCQVCQVLCPCVLSLRSLRSEERKMPEGICCCLQTCIVVFLILLTEYIMHTNFYSHSLLPQGKTRKWLHWRVGPRGITQP